MAKPIAAVSLVMMEDGEIGFSKSDECDADMLTRFASKLVLEAVPEDDDNPVRVLARMLDEEESEERREPDLVFDVSDYSKYVIYTDMLEEIGVTIDHFGVFAPMIRLVEAKDNFTLSFRSDGNEKSVNAITGEFPHLSMVTAILEGGVWKVYKVDDALRELGVGGALNDNEGEC